jgi:hypothetical protein
VNRQGLAGEFWLTETRHAEQDEGDIASEKPMTNGHVIDDLSSFSVVPA